MQEKLKMKDIRERLRARWDELPDEFYTFETFPFFTEEEVFFVRRSANLALRGMERAGRVRFIGKGPQNTSRWKKRSPETDPTGYAAQAAAKYLAALCEILPAEDLLAEQCLLVLEKIEDRYGVGRKSLSVATGR
ncbi:MAG: hypothetical protein SF339_15995 [Blastocatellia bacterium]|jgi:hypothetical protein|nr:hypothetical protein [Blastocatellia bacterium]